MRKLALVFMAALGANLAFGAEGDIGTQAYSWANYSDLNTPPATYSLSAYLGKVVLMNVFQYDCAGCDANAPAIGKLADSIGSGKAGIPFQAVGTEIDNGTYAQIQASYNTQLKKNAPNVNYPLVHVPFDTAITTDGVGTKWHRYNSYRDVYFVIDYTGKIVARIAGNRLNAMPADSLAKIRNAIATAIAAVPTSIGINARGAGFTVFRQGNGFRFAAGSNAKGPMTLQILDPQGRMIRVFSLSSASQAVWNGLDAGGRSVPFGTYFVRATASGFSASQRIDWIP